MAEGFQNPVELKYTREHEWVRTDEQQAIATVGITAYAQHALGDVVYVELGAVGKKVEQFKPFGVVESVKAASDLFSPLSGEVIEINTHLSDHPELVNADPYGAGWMIKIKIADRRELENLMNASEYDAFIATL